jgi:hypothetical protein
MNGDLPLINIINGNLLLMIGDLPLRCSEREMYK